MERLTLDEAIAHARETSAKKRKQADNYRTYSLHDGHVWNDNIEGCEDCAKEHEQLAEWLTQLKEYQQLEKQGRLIKLPCKVGDTVYCIFNRYTKCTSSNERFDECSCQGCEYECDSKKENYVQDMRAYSLDWIVTNLKNFGKTVFLTKSDAEARLKELRGNQNGKV